MPDAVRNYQRFSADNPCPICGGHGKALRGGGRRCHGFLGRDGKFAHCTREELAGEIRMGERDTFAHMLEGDCRCGRVHGQLAEGSENPAPRGGTEVLSETTYDYEGGLRVVRRDLANGDKTFLQQHKNGGSGYVYGKGDVVLTLYRAPELRDTAAGAFVFLVEGEKCVDRLRLHGLVAVTTPGGSSSWHDAAPRAAALLKGRHVVILPDNDKAGRKYADAAKETLKGAAATLRIVDLPGLEDAEDVVDWLKKGGEPEDLVRLAEAQPDIINPPTVIDEAWKHTAVEMLTVQPEPRKWLLQHPTHKGDECDPRDGDGLLGLGKAGLLASAGGVGKTSSLVQLAVAIIVGRRWFDHFNVGHHATGRVLLALAEEDMDDCHRKLYAAAQAHRLSYEERRLVAERLVVLPLAGHAVRLLMRGADGVSIEDAPELRSLNRLLTAGGEWSLIGIDPLARWGGNVGVEMETDGATRFVQALEGLTRVPGTPAVITAHHSSKISRREGKADVRGVTALSDAARWVATLVMDEDETSAHFQQVKTNHSPPMTKDLLLVRGDEGLLRVPDVSDRRRREAAQDAKDAVNDRIDDEREVTRVFAMMELLTKRARESKAALTSQDGLRGLVKGGTNLKHTAIVRLLASGCFRKDEVNKCFLVIRDPRIEDV